MQGIVLKSVFFILMIVSALPFVYFVWYLINPTFFMPLPEGNMLFHVWPMLSFILCMIFYGLWKSSEQRASLSGVCNFVCDFVRDCFVRYKNKSEESYSNQNERLGNDMPKYVSLECLRLERSIWAHLYETNRSATETRTPVGVSVHYYNKLCDIDAEIVDLEVDQERRENGS